MKTQALVGLAVALGMGPTRAADARGPRPSIVSSTRCSLDLPGGGEAYLVVTTTLEDKSSGATVPEVRMGSAIDGTYKTAPGKSFDVLDTAVVDPVPVDVDPMLTVIAEFELCNDDGTVRTEVLDARELNGQSTIFYGISGGIDESRDVENRCTADDSGVGGGIKVQEVIDAIVAACELMP